jgi:Stage II sporulation protein E (SpoIIE)/GAF domain
MVTNDQGLLPLTGAEVPHPFPGLPLPATAAEVASFVALRAAACVGADYSNLAILSTNATSLRLYHHPFLNPEMSDRYTDVPLKSAYPIAVAADLGRVVLLPDLDAYRQQFPEILDDTMAAGVEASASLPLYRFDGTLLGAIGFAWTGPTDFDAKLEAALRAVAHLCVETVERAYRYDADHELVRALQSRLLGDLPVLLGVSTATQYRPATSALSVGGDWYEGLLLGDSTIAFVVGDVTGHGIEAAADMALIRGMISALLHAGIPLGKVFNELSGVLVQRSAALLATAAVAVVDISAQRLTYTTAGHPSPLLRLTDGEVRRLDTANGAMIGISSDRQGTAVSIPFPPGAQLVMFTDGLIERRDRPFYAGIEQAVLHLGAVTESLGPHQLVESLVDALLHDVENEDDVVVLVVENTS